MCRAALARRDITAPVGIYHRMWGAATHDCSTGVHRPLTATALALAPAESTDPLDPATQLLVGIDHCLLWTDQMEALRAAVCQVTALRPEQLHISFSHTHAAGLMDPSRADLPGGELIAPYLEYLADRIADAVAEALGRLQMVRIAYNAGFCTLAKHRDYWDAELKAFVCGFNPDVSAVGNPASTVLVARIDDEQGHTVGTIVNYACHPTTLAWGNTLISPDYVGAMRELVETATGAPCLFLQGASGDLGPREGFVGDTEVADRNGRQLGYAALSAIEGMPPAGTCYEYAGPVISGATIGTWQYRPLSPQAERSALQWQVKRLEIPLAYRADLPDRQQTETQQAHWLAEEKAALAAGNEVEARDARAQAERMTRQLARLRSLPPGPSVPLAVTLWRLGDALWVTLEGEHYQLLQNTLRGRFAQHPLILATVTGGWRPGYVPTADTFGRGIYQESIAVVAPGSLEQIIETISAALTDLLKNS